MQRLFMEEGEIILTEDIDLILGKAKMLSELDDSHLNKYVDLELANKSTQAYLDQDTTLVTEDLLELLSTESLTAVNSFLDFGISIPDKAKFRIRFFRWKKLKEKIRRIICSVLGEYEESEGEINWKEIIRKVLIALGGSFVGGLPGFVITIVTVLIAKALKKGIGRICPAV